MEPIGSFSSLLNPATGLFPEQDKFVLYNQTLFLASSLILSSHIRLSLPSGLYPWGFPNKTVYGLLISVIRARYPIHLILFDTVNLIIFAE
jgi:hypothetical protein